MHRASLVAVLLSLSIFPVFGASIPADLNLSATVAPACVISTTPVAFGSYDPIGANATAYLDGTGTVSVACTRGTTPVRVDLQNGNNYSGTRRMSSGSDFLAYGLYQDPGRASSWGQGLGANGGRVIGASANIFPRTYTIYGRIPAGQDVSAGDYFDTVVATANY